MRRAITALSLLVLLLASTLSLGCSTGYDKTVLPQTQEISTDLDGWTIAFVNGGWRGGKLTITLSITNTRERRDFPIAIFSAVDSTGKTAWPPSYTPSGYRWDYDWWWEGEYYPNATHAGELNFNLNVRSGDTLIYINAGGGIQGRFLLYHLEGPPSN